MMKGITKSTLLCCFVLGAALLLPTACQMPSSAYFQKEAALKNGEWKAAYQPVFTVEVKDTSASYQTYLLLRHDDSYPFSNIWLRLSTKQPGDTAFTRSEKINLTLADMSGSWLGKGMGSIWEHKIPLGRKEGLHFPQPGIYQIQMTQIMREDPLPGVMNVGIMIEKRN